MSFSHGFITTKPGKEAESGKQTENEKKKRNIQGNNTE